MKICGILPDEKILLYAYFSETVSDIADAIIYILLHPPLRTMIKELLDSSGTGVSRVGESRPTTDVTDPIARSVAVIPNIVS